MASLGNESKRRRDQLSQSRPADGPPVRNQGGMSRPVANKPRPFVPSAPVTRARKDSIVRPVTGSIPPPPGNRLARGNETGVAGLTNRGPQYTPEQRAAWKARQASNGGMSLTGSRGTSGVDAQGKEFFRPAGGNSASIPAPPQRGASGGGMSLTGPRGTSGVDAQGNKFFNPADGQPAQPQYTPEQRAAWQARHGGAAPAADPRVAGQVGDHTDLAAAEQNLQNAIASGDPEFIQAATNRREAARRFAASAAGPTPASPAENPAMAGGTAPQNGVSPTPGLPGQSGAPEGVTPPGTPLPTGQQPGLPGSVQEALARVQAGGGVPDSVRASLDRLRASGAISQEAADAVMGAASVPPPPGSPQAQGATVPQPPQVTPDGQQVPNGPDGQPLKPVPGKNTATMQGAEDGNDSMRRTFQDASGKFYDKDGRLSSLQGINPDTGQPDPRHQQSPVQGVAQGMFDRTLEAASNSIAKIAGSDPVRTQELQQDARRQVAEFGDFPSMDDPDAPPPPIRPGGRSFNPFTGKYTNSNQPPAFKMLGVTEEHEEAWKQEYMQRINGGLL